MWKNDSWILHQDNAPAYPPLYPPDVTPWDFYLFPNVKSALKGTHLASMEELKENKQLVTNQELQNWGEQCKAHVLRCINRRGGYVVGDKASYNFLQ